MNIAATTPNLTVTPAARSVTPSRTVTNGNLPPLPDQLPTSTKTTIVPSGDEGWPCKTMADVEEFNRREEQEAIAKRAALLPPIEDSNAFLGRPIAKPPVLIDGLLKQKRIMVLGASSKIGKTWTLINLAISIASGQPWLGLNTTKGKVLYLNFELADDEMQERIEAVKIARCIILEDGQLDVWGLHGVEWVNLGSGGQFQALFDGRK